MQKTGDWQQSEVWSITFITTKEGLVEEMTLLYMTAMQALLKRRKGQLEM